MHISSSRETPTDLGQKFQTQGLDKADGKSVCSERGGLPNLDGTWGSRCVQDANGGPQLPLALH